ncbi:hypothetical protein Taro_054891, partial [Colocasia esculenta]|nr:hypothetical protein [Colocasia esculenta]
ESLGLYEVGKKVGETVDGQLQRLTQGCRAVLAKEPGAEADQDLRRFLILFLGRLLFAMRGDAVHCRFLPLLEDLDEVGDYAWGATFLAHQFDSLGASERQTSTSGFFPFLQVWAYLHLSVLRRGILERPGLVPIARRWDSHRDTHTLSDQLASLQDAIDSYPHLDVVWRPYLEEGDEGQPWLVQAPPYFGRSVWRSLGLRQSAVEFPSRDWTPRPGRSFWGLHDTTDWHERAKEQIQNWEYRGKQVKSSATTDDAYLQAFALKYGAKVYKGARRQRKELERVRRAVGAGASSSRAERELRTTTDHASQLQGQVDAATGERDQLCIRAEAAELLVAETTRELATLRVQGSSVDQVEMARLRTEIGIDELRGLVTTLGQAARSSSRSRTDVSGASGASVRQYLAGSSSRRRNKEEERRHHGEASAQSGRVVERCHHLQRGRRDLERVVLDSEELVSHLPLSLYI